MKNGMIARMILKGDNLKPPAGITWGIASIITFLLIIFALVLSWCGIWYIKGYVEKDREMEVKERIELQERREYFIENPLTPANELPIIVDEPELPAEQPNHGHSHGEDNHTH